MSLNSCFITPEAEVTLMFQPTQFPLHVRSQCHLVHYRPNEERVSLWVLAEKQQTPRPPSGQGKTNIQLQKCFSIILGISDTGKHNPCLSWTDVLAPEWEQTRALSQIAVLDVNCCNFHCPCWKGLKIHWTSACPLTCCSQLASRMETWGQRRCQEMDQKD